MGLLANYYEFRFKNTLHSVSKYLENVYLFLQTYPFTNKNTKLFTQKYKTISTSYCVVDKLFIHALNSSNHQMYLGHAGVDVKPTRLVDDFAGGRVVGAVGNVVVHHDDDSLVRDAMTMQDLVGVANIRLMPAMERKGINFRETYLKYAFMYSISLHTVVSFTGRNFYYTYGKSPLTNT